MKPRTILAAFQVLIPFVVTGANAVVQAADMEESFTLQSGKYMMTTVVTQDDSAESEKGSIVEITVTNDGSVTIFVSKNRDSPIEGRLEKNQFTATVNDARGQVQFEGELTGNNKLSGTVTRRSKDGAEQGRGTFKLKFIKAGNP